MSVISLHVLLATSMTVTVLPLFVLTKSTRCPSAPLTSAGLCHAAARTIDLHNINSFFARGYLFHKSASFFSLMIRTPGSL
jgi:hypothetical protein